MNLSDRITQSFGLQDEPNCTTSIDADSGDLTINCTLESVCIFLRRNRLEQIVRGGVAFQIPYINIKYGSELVYRFPPLSALKYELNWEKCNPGVKEKIWAKEVERMKLSIMSQMSIETDEITSSSNDDKEDDQYLL